MSRGVALMFGALLMLLLVLALMWLAVGPVA